MKRSDDQELWDLLGSAKEPAISPLFARNVLREIRANPSRKFSWKQFFTRPRLGALSAAAAVMVFASLALFTSKTIAPRHPALAVSAGVKTPPDEDFDRDIDDLVASSDDDDDVVAVL